MGKQWGKPGNGKAPRPTVILHHHQAYKQKMDYGVQRIKSATLMVSVALAVFRFSIETLPFYKFVAFGTRGNQMGQWKRKCSFTCLMNYHVHPQEIGPCGV